MERKDLEKRNEDRVDRARKGDGDAVTGWKDKGLGKEE